MEYTENEKDMGKLRVREEMRTREAQGAGRDMKNQEIEHFQTRRKYCKRGETLLNDKMARKSRKRFGSEYQYYHVSRD